ncbi:solute carrier family 25 member 53-like [Acipenser oxyrinchus oxyrinchus]|uniref:Solute carrier family 25 member 53-like n=1 Tax=Acipenser oxyrinchus oxyrinchus TaxID=40147 RepID=A0AAD8G7E8_ACIOX|nr:solute carrier family 25 member 53-like [Acipenser oxyrinchus oxyrinchus]
MLGVPSRSRRMQAGNPDSQEAGTLPGGLRWWTKSYVNGAASNLLTTLVTFPIYKTIFRQQLHVVMVQEALRQLHKEGLSKFYRGVLPPLLAKTVQGTVLFGTYDTVLHWISPQATLNGPQSLYHCSLAGMLSGFIEALVLTPCERVQNVLQDSRKDARLPTIRSILQEFNSYGVGKRLKLGYYRGLFPIIFRNGLGSALYFSFKDPIRDALSEKGLPNGLSSFVSGSVNGMGLSLLLYPLSVLITNMQTQVGGEVRSTGHTFRALWESRQGRVSLLYRGGSLVIFRSCITWGLTTAIYESLKGRSGGRN